MSRTAHNEALRYLALARDYKLSGTIRNQLTEVVLGHTGPCDEAAARQGIEWMREKFKAQGKKPRF